MITRISLALFMLAASMGAAHAATVVVRAEGVGSAQGMVYAGVCDTSFDETRCPYKGRARARLGTVELRIPNVKPGRYAIAIYHDVNGNGRLDKTFFLPSEPYGFSNNIGRGAVPSFEGALIGVGEPTTTVVVPIR